MSQNPYPVKGLLQAPAGQPPLWHIAGCAARLVTLSAQAELLQRQGNARFAYDPANGLVFILGSDDPEDWKQNLDMHTLTRHGGKFHKGFVHHAELVMVGLRDLVLWGSESRGSLASVADIRGFVGHSLGGAVAEYLGRLYGKPVLTFGQPRCWRARPAAGASHHTRVYLRADAVIGFPPSVSFAGLFDWSHACDVKVRLGKPRWLVAAMDWIFRRNPLRHHYLESYLTACAKKGI